MRDKNYPMIVEPIILHYPPYQNGDYIEEYFFEYQRNKPISSSREYIPISFTTLVDHCGKTQEVNNYLRKFCDPSKLYYCVVMGDGAIAGVQFPADTLIFSCTNGGSSYTKTIIPVAASSLNTEQIDISQKTMFASFVGSETHTIRRQLMDYIGTDPRIYGYIKPWSAAVTPTEFQLYEKMSKKSRFVLCPRGNAFTSYKIYEAMQWSAVPIIFSDEIHFPMQDVVDWDKLCLHTCTNFKATLDRAYNMTDAEWKERTAYGWKCYHEYFTQSGVSEYIANTLTKLHPLNT